MTKTGSCYGHRQALGCLLWLDLNVSEQTETAGDHGEPLVGRPQPSVRSEPGRGEKLGVDVADAQPVELLCRDQAEDLGIGGDLGRWEGGQQTQDVLPLGQVAEGQFAGHPRVSEHQATVE
jgi:hypothetical protein